MNRQQQKARFDKTASHNFSKMLSRNELAGWCNMLAACPSFTSFQIHKPERKPVDTCSARFFSFHLATRLRRNRNKRFHTFLHAFFHDDYLTIHSPCLALALSHRILWSAMWAQLTCELRSKRVFPRDTESACWSKKRIVKKIHLIDYSNTRIAERSEFL